MAAGAVGPGILSGLVQAAETADMERPKLHLFSKVLQFLDYAELADTTAALGYDGLDLTVRPGGHVEPDNFERDLPAAVKAMENAGLSREMMVTRIVGTQNRRDFDLLALARSLGIKSYRLGGLKYEKGVPATESVKRYMYQNHSGERSFGAAIWDLYLAIKDLNPDALGVQFDVRHAVTEGGRNWADGFRLVKPLIRSLAFKDFIWAEVDGQWKLVNVPMGEGMVDFGRYFRMLKDAGMEYPVSVHCEYELGGAEKGKREPTMPRGEILAAVGGDVEAIDRIWGES
jgi:sugar phosphate isomerase/epimerase